jgi:hypothetical protein
MATSFLYEFYCIALRCFWLRCSPDLLIVAWVLLFCPFGGCLRATWLWFLHDGYEMASWLVSFFVVVVAVGLGMDD